MNEPNLKIKDMDPVKIKSQMILAGVTQTDIANELGVSQPSVNRVIAGIDVSDRIRRAIAEAIGINVKRIWPSTYLYGRPRKPGRPRSF